VKLSSASLFKIAPPLPVNKVMGFVFRRQDENRNMNIECQGD